MSIFRDFFVKEKPVFTGITRGLGGFGIGASGGSGGGGGGPLGFTIKRYNTSNVLQSTTIFSDATSGLTYTHTVAGYYTLEVNPTSGPAQIEMWAWGAGGGTGGGPGPGRGGAGGGVRGTHTITGGDTITFLVGGGGAYESTTDGLASSFPDGGSSLGDGYIEGPGGGRSSIYDGLLPYANRDATPNTFLLIGGGGGGGSHYISAGTMDARAGYPSGFPGGGYYPADGSVYGGGGSQSAGGAQGPGGRQPAGTAGAKYDGGPGHGGAGGGGYYGGGGAGGYYAMGGGGSGYIHPSLTNTASFTTAAGGSDHYQALDDPSNPGIKPASGGDSGMPSASNGGQDGCVVFRIV